MIRALKPKAAAHEIRTLFTQRGVELTHTDATDLVARLFGAQAWSHLAQQVAAAVSKKPVAGPSPSHAKEKNAQRAPRRTPLTLQQVLEQHYGAWGSCAAFPRKDWAYEVSNGGTSRGYWEWVTAEVEAHSQDEQTEARWSGPWKFLPGKPCRVTLPGGETATWDIETDLSDRWGRTQLRLC